MKTESLGEMLLKLADQMERLMSKRNDCIGQLVSAGDDRYVRVVEVKRHTVREHTRSKHIRRYIIRKRR